MNLKELIAKQKAIVDKARADGRAMSEEEKRTFNELQTEIDKLKIEEATKNNSNTSLYEK